MQIRTKFGKQITLKNLKKKNIFFKCVEYVVLYVCQYSRYSLLVACFANFTVRAVSFRKVRLRAGGAFTGARSRRRRHLRSSAGGYIMG